MNELLQKHGCANVFNIPEGLRELMADISREVLRKQPVRLCEFITNYLAVLLVTREHGILSTKIIEDLCDCRPSVSEHLLQLELPLEEAKAAAEIIKHAVEKIAYVEGKEKLKEEELLRKISKKVALDEEKMAKVCLVARNAYKDYWYRKMLLEESLQKQPELPWEIAAQHTLEVYKKTRPSFAELTRATERIQAAYRGFYVRKRMLKKLRKAKGKNTIDSKTEVQGAPDIGGEREMDFGRVVDINVKMDDMDKIFAEKDIIGTSAMKPPPPSPHTVHTSASAHETESSHEMQESRQRQQSRMISSKMHTTPLFGSDDTPAAESSALPSTKHSEFDPFDDEVRAPSFHYDPKETTY